MSGRLPALLPPAVCLHPHQRPGDALRYLLPARSHTSSTCATRMMGSQYTLAIASDSRTSASSWRTCEEGTTIGAREVRGGMFKKCGANTPPAGKGQGDRQDGIVARSEGGSSSSPSHGAICTVMWPVQYAP